jgi:hypothetical protein
MLNNYVCMLFHNSKPRNWFQMMLKDSSLRTNRYSRYQWQQSSPSMACAHGSYTTTLPNFGGLRLTNGSLQRAHF